MLKEISRHIVSLQSDNLSEDQFEPRTGTMLSGMKAKPVGCCLSIPTILTSLTNLAEDPNYAKVVKEMKALLKKMPAAR